MDVGRITKVKIRDVWKHEASDFSKWLLDNIDILSETVDINLQNPELEKTAGSFSVDIVAQDDNQNFVVIENQLEKTNHDHLGKILTYMIAMDAKTAIWISTECRPEHIAVLAWLNESSSANFYMVKVEAIRIHNSPPAPLLTLIVGPTEESRQVGAKKDDFAAMQVIRMEFWSGLLNLFKEKMKESSGLFCQVTPQNSSWIQAGSGRSGITYKISLRQNDSRIELYIDRGKDQDQENKRIFDALIKRKGEIENIFGSQLEWLRMDNNRYSSIRYTVSIGGYKNDKSEWPLIFNEIVKATLLLQKATLQFIIKLEK